MSVTPTLPLKTSAPLFREAASYAEKARAARSDGVRRAYENLADRFLSLGIQRQSEERDAESPPDT